jgi:hypothetical protein
MPMEAEESEIRTQREIRSIRYVKNFLINQYSPVSYRSLNIFFNSYRGLAT